MSNTRLTGDGPNEPFGTSAVWLTPGFVKSQTPFGKIVFSRASSAVVNATL